MKARIFVAIAAVVALSACGQTVGDKAADTVYTNGRIYTVNDAQPWVEAVAIKDGAFIAVGSNADIEAVTGNDTEVVDLGGRFVMPGLHDTHLHFESAYRSPMLEGAMLTYTPDHDTIEELQQALVEYANANPDVKVSFLDLKGVNP